MLKIIKYENEDDWKRHRLQGVSSSEAAALLGESPWMSREELRMLKLGRHRQDFDRKTRARFQAGHALEPAIAARAYREHPELFAGRVLIDPEQAIQARQIGANDTSEGAWLQCTVDRLLAPELHGYFAPHLAPEAYPSFHILEAKSSSALPVAIPYHYRIQVQHQMLVTQCPKAYVALVAIRDTHRWDKLSTKEALLRFAEAPMVIWEETPDEEIQARLQEEALKLWDEIRSYLQ